MRVGEKSRDWDSTSAQPIEQAGVRGAARITKVGDSTVVERLELRHPTTVIDVTLGAPKKMRHN